MNQSPRKYDAFLFLDCDDEGRAREAREGKKAGKAGKARKASKKNAPTIACHS